MKNHLPLWAILAISILPLQAQDIADLVRPAPEALCYEAPLPPAEAEIFARLISEQKGRYATPTSPATANTSSELKAKMQNLLRSGGETFAISYDPSAEYQVIRPNYKLMNSSRGKERIKGDGGKFNVKKDRLSSAVLYGSSIVIVNHSDKTVDMSEFSFETESKAIRMEGNKIVLTVPVLAIATGEAPADHKIVCTHTASGLKYTFDLHMYWTKKMTMHGEKHAFAVTTLGSDSFPDLGVLCDLDEKTLRFVHLPLVIRGEGRDGKDGQKGAFGLNGTNKLTSTDSNGNTKVIVPGTCAQPGGDGKDGENGEDGGQFLICVSPDFVQTFGLNGLLTTIDAGKAGKGGKGGEGGIHGKGSSCSGKAPDGKNGKDGVDGKRGDFLYVLTDVDSFCQKAYMNR